MLQTISIDRTKLIQKLKENKKIHIKEYEEAVKNYKIIAKYAMEQMAKNAQKTATLYKKKAKIIETSEDLDDWNVDYIHIDKSPIVNIELPRSHALEYDEAIEMLELHCPIDESLKDTIQLTQDDFRKFVRDDWEWKKGWSIANSIVINESSNVGLGTTNPLNKLHIYKNN